jgi:hypothetical protein
MRGSMNSSCRLLAFSAIAALVLVACGDKGSGKGVTNPASSDIGADAAAYCADNFTAEQKATADSLVQLATDKAVQEMELMIEAMDEDGMQGAKANSPQESAALFEQALQVAPGHCGALFGKTLTEAAKIVESEELNSLVEDATQSEESSTNALFKTSGKALMRTNADDLPQLLMRTQVASAQADEVTIERAQLVAETVILPKLNEAISRLDAIMQYDNFEFNITKDNETVQIDRGEVGPVLFGLKVIKAYVITFVGTNLDVTLNGNYDWVETLEDLSKDIDAFDNLTGEQTAALDHVTGFFSPQSNVLGIKANWKAAYEGVPDLLLSGIKDLQAGLAYGIQEASGAIGTGQENDVYKVGTGADADVDPADLQTAIDALDIFASYLEGEKTITWDKGNRSLKVNLRKLYTNDKWQNRLPYFKFRPYEQWNDVISADTTWETYSLAGNSYVYGDVREKLNRAVNAQDDWSYSVYYTENEQLGTGFQLSYYDWGSLYGNSVVVYFIVPKGNEQFEITQYMQCEYDRWGDPENCVDLSVPAVSTVQLNTGCVATELGLRCPEYIDREYLGFFYFTNAQGESTLDWKGFEKINEPKDLEGKVIFPDPTFGGVFPGLTNETIWDHIQSLENVQLKSPRNCSMVAYYDEYYDYTYYDEQCTLTVPGSDASDLDLLAYYFALLAD